MADGHKVLPEFSEKENQQMEVSFRCILLYLSLFGLSVSWIILLFLLGMLTNYLLGLKKKTNHHINLIIPNYFGCILGAEDFHILKAHCPEYLQFHFGLE